MARKKSQAGRKTLLRAFYTQLMRHAFALGVSAAGGTYEDGLRTADSPLGKSAIALAANDAAERDLDKTPQMARGGIVMEPTYALIGEAGPEAVIPLTGPLRPRRKSNSKYRTTYRREFRRISSRYKKKNGTWKKGGFKAAVRAAHRATRKIVN